MNKFFVRAATAAALLSTMTVPVLAHVTLEVQEAAIGGSYKAVVRVPHGCSGQATNTVRVQIPEGFYSAKPMPKAGWTLETVTGPYENAYASHGNQITEGVTEIVWSGGELPDAWYDEFIFRGTFADNLEPGTFYFPTVQECANGEEAWIDTSGDADADMPAPHLELIPGSGGHSH